MQQAAHRPWTAQSGQKMFGSTAMPSGKRMGGTPRGRLGEKAMEGRGGTAHKPNQKRCPSMQPGARPARTIVQTHRPSQKRCLRQATMPTRGHLGAAERVSEERGEILLDRLCPEGWRERDNLIPMRSSFEAQASDCRAITYGNCLRAIRGAIRWRRRTIRRRNSTDGRPSTTRAPRSETRVLCPTTAAASP